MSISRSTDQQAILHALQHARDIANKIVTGTLEPVAGTQQIHQTLGDAVGHPYQLRAWCYLDTGIHPREGFMKELSGKELDTAILSEATKLLQQAPDEILHTLETPDHSWRALLWGMDQWLGGLLVKLKSLMRETVRGPDGLTTSRPAWVRRSLHMAAALLTAAGLLLWSAALMAAPPLAMLAMTWAPLVTGIPLCLWAGYVFIALGQRARMQTAFEAIQANPDDQIILYLRSFALDHVDEGAPEKHDRIAFAPREEQILASIFNLAGPFVGLGDPNDAVSGFGAARAYVDSNGWQDRVRSLMNQSKIVLLRVSDTESFLWEAETALKELPAERILFYFSQHLSIDAKYRLYRILKDHIDQFLPESLPYEMESERFIRFDAEHRPILFGPMQKATYTNVWTRSLSAMFTRWNWRARLVGAMKDYFIARGMATRTGAMFSNRSVIASALLSGPALAGAMTSRNLWVAGLRGAAGLLLLSGIVLAGLLLYGLHLGEVRLLSAAMEANSRVTQLIFTAGWVMFVGSTFVSIAGSAAWVAHAPLPVRRHLTLGGKLIRGIWVVPLVIIGTVLWWFAIMMVLSPESTWQRLI